MNEIVAKCADLAARAKRLLSQCTSWIKRVWYWVAELPTFWGFLAVLVICIVLPMPFGIAAADAIRYSGLLLQLVGIGVVAYTLRGRGKLFGRLSVLRFTWQWIRRAPRFRPRPIVLEAGLTSSSTVFGTADAEVWRGPRLDQSLDAQLEALRENLETLRSRVDSLAQRQSVQLSEVQHAIAAQRAELTQQAQTTKRTLEGVAADSLYLEVAGLAALVLGIVSATVPAELATCLGFLLS